ncbi:MAG: hypothetical protein FJ279_29750, partial [Planctomycetes bacterium]|nr:hypothetical protein [Planctomycetota bacterium]
MSTSDNRPRRRPLRRSSSTTILRGALGVFLFAMLALPWTLAWANPTAEQEAYWWQDELREVAFALSKARTGKVAQWPRMTVTAGSGILPLPRATGPITVDGKLDEPAWTTATTFPVGPLFGPWREGPFILQVRACRDDKTLYLALESPRDLTDLGALTQSGELLQLDGQPFHADPLRITHYALRTTHHSSRSHILELARPLAKPNAPISLSFPAELVRRAAGKLPPELATLGLVKHAKPIWLDPITLTLVPADTSAHLTWNASGTKDAPLSYRLTDGQAGALPLASHPGGIHTYSWQAKWQNRTFHLDGFLYVEPVAEML